jgi:hypothetical protein
VVHDQQPPAVTVTTQEIGARPPYLDRVAVGTGALISQEALASAMSPATTPCRVVVALIVPRRWNCRMDSPMAPWPVRS